mgnify:CR=1 FL=1
MKLASHNSLSFVKPRKWWEKLINFTSKCQSYDIETQYEYGVRLFDIRIRRAMFEPDSYYCAKSAHGLITYDVRIVDVLRYLDTLSTKEDPIYVYLSLENKKCEKDRDYVWFKNAFNLYEEMFPNLIFCGGYVKYPWHKIIDCENPFICQRNWEFYNYKDVKDGTITKIKCFFSNLLHFSPEYWAKKNNQKHKSDGTSADFGTSPDFLMLDFVQYGDI